MAEQSWGETLRDLGHDLVNIETNTILSDGVTGRKMPSYPHALLDIIDKYATYLTQKIGLDLESYRDDFDRNEGQTEENRQKPSELVPRIAEDVTLSRPLHNGVETFDLLRWAACSVLAHAETATAAGRPLGPEKRAVLGRIRRNCDQLKPIAEALGEMDTGKNFIGLRREDLIAKQKQSPPPKLPKATPELLTRIRKIWDIGTDEIVLQTVVQLDGDILFRARSGYSFKSKDPLMEAHQRATDLGLTHWKSMFELVASLITRLAGQIFGGSEPRETSKSGSQGSA